MNEELKKNISKKGKITGNTNSHFFNIGEIVTIVGVSTIGDDLYKCEGTHYNDQWSVYTSEIEILEDIPIKNEDKTGKKYRCIENNVHFTTSDIITLIKDDGSCCCLYQSNNGTKAYFMNDKLVPMSEDTPDDKDRTGKKYRCIEAGYNFVVGDIVTMVEDDKTSCCGYKRVGCSANYAYNSSFVPVSDDTPETKPETKPDTKHKFKEGDRVKVIGRNPKNIYGGIEGKTAIVKSLNGWVNGIEKYILTFDSESFNRYWDLTEDLELVSSEGDRNHLSNGDSHSTVTTVKKNKLMEKLRKIPSTLKRILDKDLQAMYKVGFINGDLALTAEGEKEVLNYLITVTATKKAISDIAKAIIVESKEDK